MRVRATRWLAVLALLSACTVRTNWFDTTPPKTKRADGWQRDTDAAAQAYSAGDYQKAELRLEAARERAAARGADDLALAASLTNLAVVRRAQGDTTGAIRLLQEALAIRERVFGADDPEVAATLNSLAALYSAQDDFATAEALLQRALTIREQALGPAHRYTAQSLNNLALLYAAQGRYGEAEPLYQRALAICEGGGAHQSDLVTILENYAALLADTGRRAEAEQVEARAHALRPIEPPAPR